MTEKGECGYLVENFLFFLFILTWVTGTAAMGFWANVKGKAYLRRLPPYEGVPLDIYIHVGMGWKKGGGPVRQAYREQQADPELERLRQEERGRSRHVLAWMFGFPALVSAVMVVLILSGVVH